MLNNMTNTYRNNLHSKTGPSIYKQASFFNFSSILAAMTASFFMRKEVFFKILLFQTLLGILQNQQ
jgi:hypothetical protein